MTAERPGQTTVLSVTLVGLFGLQLIGSISSSFGGTSTNRVDKNGNHDRPGQVKGQRSSCRTMCTRSYRCGDMGSGGWWVTLISVGLKAHT